MFDAKALNIFYTDISVPGGINITDFQNKLKDLFAQDRSENDKKDYRLGKNPWKKLRDEIMPVSRFLKFKGIEKDRVHFPLNNSVPDCWLLYEHRSDFGIEVTIERGREKYRLTSEMNKTGIGRGFIGIQDDASQKEFNDRMSKPSTGYTTEQILDATKDGILRCLSEKNDPTKYKGVSCLLVSANLITLPKERWEFIKKELFQQAINLSFQEVHIIADTEPWGFQIK